ncbi:hypothetical protein ACHAWF_017593 [Thalassiosira exigua]
MAPPGGSIVSLSVGSGPSDGKGEKRKRPTAPGDDESSFLVRVSDTLPPLDEVQAFLSSPGCGAISTFAGITRDNFAGKTVTRLSYEGYTPMAVKEMKNMCREAKAKYPTVDKLVAAHILGDCPVGQASVIVGCSSPHRREAIRCTEYLIDELKGRVPIWKKEVYEGDEESVWKENVEWHEGKRRRVMVKEKEKG